jgi:hypothetical protein
VEDSINNFAVIGMNVRKPLYNDLQLYRSRTKSSNAIPNTIDHGEQTMQGLAFLTMKYELSDDENFGDGEIKAVTLSSIDEYDLGEYGDNMPFLDDVMTDIQSFDPDSDGEEEIVFNYKGSIGYRAEESYFGTAENTPFDDINNYTTASTSMFIRRPYNGNSYNDGDTIICKTSTGKYLRLELTTTRAITMDEFATIESGGVLANPIDEILSE